MKFRLLGLRISSLILVVLSSTLRSFCPQLYGLTFEGGAFHYLLVTLYQTIKFKTFLNSAHLQTGKSMLQTNIYFLTKKSLSLERKKILWEKEKLLVSSRFRFSKNIFYQFSIVRVPKIRYCFVRDLKQTKETRACKICKLNMKHNFTIIEKSITRFVSLAKGQLHLTFSSIYTPFNTLKNDWMVFYVAFNSISVISRRQLTLLMLSWVSPVLGWALKCLAQGHFHEKAQRIQWGSNTGPLDYESNTLALSHVGP